MFKDKLKGLVNPEENNSKNKKKIENLAFFIIVLIVTIILINIIWSGEKNSSIKENTNSTNGKQLAEQNSKIEETSANTSNELEVKLERRESNFPERGL